MLIASKKFNLCNYGGLCLCITGIFMLYVLTS